MDLGEDTLLSKILAHVFGDTGTPWNTPLGRDLDSTGHWIKFRSSYGCLLDPTPSSTPTQLAPVTFHGMDTRKFVLVLYIQIYLCGLWMVCLPPCPCQVDCPYYHSCRTQIRFASSHHINTSIDLTVLKIFFFRAQNLLCLCVIALAWIPIINCVSSKGEKVIFSFSSSVKLLFQAIIILAFPA